MGMSAASFQLMPSNTSVGPTSLPSACPPDHDDLAADHAGGGRRPRMVELGQLLPRPLAQGEHPVGHLRGQVRPARHPTADHHRIAVVGHRHLVMQRQRQVWPRPPRVDRRVVRQRLRAGRRGPDPAEHPDRPAVHRRGGELAGDRRIMARAPLETGRRRGRGGRGLRLLLVVAATPASRTTATATATRAPAPSPISVRRLGGVRLGPDGPPPAGGAGGAGGPGGAGGAGALALVVSGPAGAALVSPALPASAGAAAARLRFRLTCLRAVVGSPGGGETALAPPQRRPGRRLLTCEQRWWPRTWRCPRREPPRRPRSRRGPCPPPTEIVRWGPWPSRGAPRRRTPRARRERPRARRGPPRSCAPTSSRRRCRADRERAP